MKQVISFITIVVFLNPLAWGQKILSLHTAADDVIVVVLESGYHDGSTYQNPVDMTIANWKIDGANVSVINRWSYPWDELEKDAQDYTQFPVMMRHHIYLTHTEKLTNQKTYAVTTPYGDQTFTFNEKSTLCESIKVNQVGYNPHATTRYANLGVYLGDGGSRKLAAEPDFEVLDAKSGEVVFSGASTYWGDETNITSLSISSGEQVYRLDLADVPKGGPYKISVKGFGVSFPFEISEAASRQIAGIVTRGMYHQRCGIALEEPYTQFTRGKCHATVAHTKQAHRSPEWINVPAGATMHPIEGGYHDAADFDRRPMHTIIPIVMLSYYEAFPENFVDNQYNIPESGNGIPDFLDEALWGMLVWEYLQEPDGGIMAGTERERHPGYGEVSAANENAVYGTWEVLDQVTADGAGMFALASRLIRPFDAARADELLAKAILAWNYLENKGVTTPEANMMYAGLQLYLATATGDEAADMASKYHQMFINIARSNIVEGGTWPQQYSSGNISAAMKASHFISYTFTSHAVDQALQDELIDLILTEADKGGYMGRVENRAYPQGATKFYAWGASTGLGRYADVAVFASRLTADPEKKQAYYDVVSQYADYPLGLNPLSQSYITGLGSKQVQSPLHLDSWYTKYGKGDHEGKPIGNVPGITVYGPTEGRSGADYQRVISNKIHPTWDNLPAQKRWADGWSLINNNEFTTWETMVWNACMYGYLYKAGEATSIKDKKIKPDTETTQLKILQTGIGTTGNRFRIITPNGEGRILVMDIKGRIIHQSIFVGGKAEFVLNHKGIYLLRMIMDKAVYNKKVIVSDDV